MLVASFYWIAKAVSTMNVLNVTIRESMLKLKKAQRKVDNTVFKNPVPRKSPQKTASASRSPKTDNTVQTAVPRQSPAGQALALRQASPEPEPWVKITRPDGRQFSVEFIKGTTTYKNLYDDAAQVLDIRSNDFQLLGVGEDGREAHFDHDNTLVGDIKWFKQIRVVNLPSPVFTVYGKLLNGSNIPLLFSRSNPRNEQLYDSAARQLGKREDELRLMLMGVELNHRGVVPDGVFKEQIQIVITK